MKQVLSVLFSQDCMEEINLFSENKTHLKQLGEQLLSASDEATQSQVHGSLQEVNQRWHNLFHHIEARWEPIVSIRFTEETLPRSLGQTEESLPR